MNLSELKNHISQGDHPELEVHGIDPSIYLIFSLANGKLQPVVDHRGNTLKYRSRSSAFDALKDVGVQRADFVHKSAFDEMVGVGNGIHTEHREPVTLSQ